MLLLGEDSEVEAVDAPRAAGEVSPIRPERGEEEDEGRRRG